MRDSPSKPNKVMPHDQAIPTDCTQEFLALWNWTKTDYPRNATIHELFETRVQREPNALAVVFKDQQLTYGQLNERANQLAHHLRSLGVKRSSMVAVCLERSMEMVISILGILKAGAAYVPLDVSYPAQRLSFMLKDTGSKVLLTREGLLDRFSNKDVQMVCLDRNKDLINTRFVSDPEMETGGDGLGREYLNRPEFTAERFIENPFSDKPGQCLYRTGDLVDYLPDGNIEFRGRADNQVKIRGFILPRTDVEKRIASVWCEILQTEKVGIFDSFFDLGGHSLLATRVVSRLSKNFMINLPTSSMFENSIIASFASFVVTFQWAGCSNEMQVCLKIHGRESGEL